MLNLDEEVRLYTNNAERERLESQATLFGIIVALEFLERAYVRDSITALEWVVFQTSADSADSELDVTLRLDTDPRVPS